MGLLIGPLDLGFVPSPFTVVDYKASGLVGAYVQKGASGQIILQLHVLSSKLLVSPSITQIVVPYIIPHISPIKEFRL